MKSDTTNRIVKKYCATLSLIAIICLVILMVASWVITSANTDLPMRSLLSSEGIRWFVGHAVDHLAQPLGVWLLLLSFTYGVVKASNILEVFHHKSPLPYRKRFALRVTLFEICVFAIVVFLFTMTPHAILLGVTGTLTTGSFVHGLIPFALLGITIFAMTYGLVSGAIPDLPHVFYAMASGLNAFSHFFVLYVFAAELYFSVLYRSDGCAGH